MGVRRVRTLGIWLLASAAVYAAGCSQSENHDDIGDGGIGTVPGTLTGPGEACVGENAIFDLEYPPESSTSPTVRYKVWLVGDDVLGSSITVNVTVDPGEGETILVSCEFEGSFEVQARGPGGDFLAEPFECVECG